MLYLMRLPKNLPLKALPSSPLTGGGAAGGHEEALRLAEEARLITERSGYALQGADVHLFLAEMALEHTQQVRELATCDGPPDYTYKVAYNEAGALLARLGVEP
jgi:hypothetical protein